MNQELNLRNIHNQKLLICSDLHGNLADFEMVCQKFYQLKNRHECDLLVLAGDLIHGYPGYMDRSLELLTRAKSMKDSGDAILLLGNHELSHLMHWELRKGSACFTSRFELAMNPQERTFWMQEFLTWPLALQTQGGVFINHSGPSQALAGMGDAKTSLIARLSGYRNWYLEAEFKHWAQAKILDGWDPELGDIYLKTPQGALLWEVFFNKNEHSWPTHYPEILNRYLEMVAPGCSLLLSMHIEEPSGYKIVAKNQLRLCSSYGCSSNSQKKVLLLDSDEVYSDAKDLLPLLVPIY